MQKMYSTCKRDLPLARYIIYEHTLDVQVHEIQHSCTASEHGIAERQKPKGSRIYAFAVCWQIYNEARVVPLIQNTLFNEKP